MTIYFHIPYTCNAGESLHVALCLMPSSTKFTLPLKSSDGENHTASFRTPAATEVRYLYEVHNEAGDTIRRETTAPRHIHADTNGSLMCSDNWGEDSPEPALMRGTFANAAFSPSRQRLSNNICVFRLLAPEPPQGYRWAISGNRDCFGQWDEHHALSLICTDTYCWEVSVPLEAFETGTRYKYLLIPEGGGSTIWEEGEDRVIADLPFVQGARYLHTDTHARINIPQWRGAGVVVPVFSLRTQGSQGIGDFGDLLNCVEWAAECGMRALQILPINDTTSSGTWTDSYPYSAISIFALHPLYIDLRDWHGCPLWTAEREAQFKALERPTLQYDDVFKAKMAFLHELYDAYGRDTLKCAECQQYIAENSKWLRSYAAFSYLRDIKGTVDFRRWGEFAEYKQESIRRWIDQNEDVKRGTGFYIYVQYLLHCQMKRVHNRAKELGVVLKGDIPIGVSPCSVAAWVDDRLFHFDGHSGAPPDFFSRHGQNWGFPTYNWEAMAEDGYAWWQARFSHMARYFDAYRLDHVLGFFRIWEIPSAQCYGVLGRFRPALPLSTEELRAAGFDADADMLCQASFSYETALSKLTKEEIDTYLSERDGRLYLKKECDSQSRIFGLTNDKRLRNALCDLCEEVLFIRDPDQPDRYHPRIMAQGTARYMELEQYQREAFDRLHDDFFYRRHNSFWAEEAMKKLPAMIGDPLALNTPSNLLLPCAEDLGFVPESLPGVLAQLHILTLEIQRMPKTPNTRFGRTKEYPYLSVCAIGTHDMSPLRLWWLEDKAQTQAYWNEVLGRSGEAPDEAYPEICEAVVSEHLDSPSMLCLLAIQDWLAISAELRAPDPHKEQINDPANPRHNWSYRLHLDLDTLRADSGFAEKIRGLIARSGR